MNSLNANAQIDHYGELYQNSLPADIRKNLGTHYTRFVHAWKLTESLLDGHPQPVKTVLEPACGGGVFAAAMYWGLVQRGYDGLTVINDILVCVDVDPQAVALTTKVLLDLEPSSSPRVLLGDTLEIAPQLGTFSIVVGNPPYVRTHNIPEGKKALYRSMYPTFTGLADLSTAFIEMGFDLLDQDGLLGYIITNKFARSLAGIPIRKKITDHLVEFDERDSKTKFKAVVDVVDLVLSKRPSTSLVVNGQEISRHLIGEKEWTFKEAPVIQGTSLDDLGVSLQLGIVSGYNSIMIGDHPDTSWTRPVATGRDLTAGKRIIYITGQPSDDAVAYLQEWKPQLTERAKGKRSWWEFQCPARNIPWGDEKWVIRRIGGSLKDFTKIGRDILVLDTCYVLVVPQDIDADKLVAVLGLPEVEGQMEHIMNKLTPTTYEIHARKFGRIIIPSEHLPSIKKL